MSLRAVSRLVGLGLTMAGLFWCASLETTSTEALQHSLEGWGLLAPVAYGALGAGLIVAFVPVVVVSGVAGLLFGPALGFPVALLAATGGAGMTFLLSRWLGGPAVDELEGERIARMRAWIADRGVAAVIAARIAPIPTSLVNYAGGVSTLSLRVFVAGSLLGFMPRIFAYVAVGDSLRHPTWETILVSVTLLLAVLVVGVIALRRNARARDLTGPLV